MCWEPQNSPSLMSLQGGQVGTPWPTLSEAVLKVVQMLCVRADHRLAADRAGESTCVLTPRGQSSHLWLVGTSQGILKSK